MAVPGELDAQPDQVIQDRRVHLTEHHRGDRRVTREPLRGIPVEPGGAVAAGHRRRRAVPGPLAADPLDPLLLQLGVSVQDHQVGQGDVGPDPGGLPGPLGEQPGADQPVHRLFQRVVVPLGVTAGVLRAARGGQRLQDGADQRGALGGQVPGEDPGPLERGLQPDGAVLEGLARVIVGVRVGAGLDLGGQGG